MPRACQPGTAAGRVRNCNVPPEGDQSLKLHTVMPVAAESSPTTDKPGFYRHPTDCYEICEPAM